MPNAISHRRNLIATDILRGIGSIIRLNEITLGPIFDLIWRLFLAQAFFVSGIIKLSDWNNALYLATNEYPVSWMDPKLAAYIGVAIEIICPVFLALGLMTRFAALPMLILAIVAQTAYHPVNAQIFWILFLGWWVVRGAGPLSLDHAFRSMRDSALPFAAFFGKLFGLLSCAVAPFYQVAVRLWIACIIYAAGHAMSGGVSFLEYQFQFSVLFPTESGILAANIGTALALLVLSGFGTRIVSLVLIVVFSTTMANVDANPAQQLEYIFWLMLLSALFVYGAGTISIDHAIRQWLAKRFPELEGKFRVLDNSLPHVVIVGAGFGGVSVASNLRTTACRVTLIDKHNYHLFQPLLYQVATASLSPADIAVPIRSLFRDQQNVRIALGEVIGVDKETRQVKLKNQEAIHYDYLVLATGARHSYFGKDEWAPFAPGMKRVEDAIAVRGKLLRAFEAAENTSDAALREKLLTFVIVGGGPTGVELAGALAELAHQGMTNEFRNIDPSKAKIYLVEAGPKLLGMMPDKLSSYTADALKSLGVTVMTGGRVEQISPDGVKVGEMFIPASNVFWAAGVQASPAAEWLGGEADRAGRLKVNPDLSVPGLENVFAVGDTVLAEVWDGKPMPGLAPAAKQSGGFVAKNIRARIEGKTPAKAFKYMHYGSMATIGRKAAVADFGSFRIKGTLAWWFWGAIHVMFLANMRNRISVMVEWFWAYLTFRRSTRLITETTTSN